MEPSKHTSSRARRVLLDLVVPLVAVAIWLVAGLVAVGCPSSPQPAATSSSPAPQPLDASAPDVCARACENGRKLGCSNLTDQCEGMCGALAVKPIIVWDAACLAGAASKDAARACAGVMCR